MLGSKKKIIENEKGEKLKIEYGMLDSGDSSIAFFFLFGLAFSFLFLMVSIMGGDFYMVIFVSLVLIIYLVGTITSVMKKRITKINKREFRDEQINDLIG